MLKESNRKLPNESSEINGHLQSSILNTLHETEELLGIYSRSSGHSWPRSEWDTLLNAFAPFEEVAACLLE